LIWAGYKIAKYLAIRGPSSPEEYIISATALAIGVGVIRGAIALMAAVGFNKWLAQTD
jgi:hypothetical protein